MQEYQKAGLNDLAEILGAQIEVPMPRSVVECSEFLLIYTGSLHVSDGIASEMLDALRFAKRTLDALGLSEPGIAVKQIGATVDCRTLQTESAIHLQGSIGTIGLCSKLSRFAR